MKNDFLILTVKVCRGRFDIEFFNKYNIYKCYHYDEKEKKYISMVDLAITLFKQEVKLYQV
jgi:hypothetical protein